MLPNPSEVLFYNQHLLPLSGFALDLACGHGSNAICLAKNGLRVSAWDISSSAVKKLSILSKQRNLVIDCEIRDVIENPPEPNTFDVIVVSRFLERELMENLKCAVTTNGLLFYQTFVKNRIGKSGPKNPDYQLNENELLDFFNDWKLIYYREESKVGNIKKGFRNEAMIISQKK